MFDLYTYFREILGPDLVFIILDMSQEDRRKRVLKRHDGSEGAADLMDVGLNIAKILNFFSSNSRPFQS